MNFADQIIEHGPYVAGDIVPFVKADEINELRDELIELRAEKRRARRKPTDCPRCGSDVPIGRWGVCEPCAIAEGWEIRPATPPADSCTCEYRPNGGPDPACPVHQGRRARGPKPPPVGPGCICDGSGRTCPRHGVVL